MPRYRSGLPQLGESIFLTDGGLETWLVFIEGVDLPCFAAFPLVATDEGRARLVKYFTPFLNTARERGVGFISAEASGIVFAARVCGLPAAISFTVETDG